MLSTVYFHNIIPQTTLQFNFIITKRIWEIKKGYGGAGQRPTARTSWKWRGTEVHIVTGRLYFGSDLRSRPARGR